ncbi:hypothetical protein BC826DRAFT_1179464 [Russula brevipes]|nr:hypothetical protein BC826DRAFT_1179464 [Russula brevipes]
MPERRCCAIIFESVTTATVAAALNPEPRDPRDADPEAKGGPAGTQHMIRKGDIRGCRTRTRATAGPAWQPDEDQVARVQLESAEPVDLMETTTATRRVAGRGEGGGSHEQIRDRALHRPRDPLIPPDLPLKDSSGFGCNYEAEVVQALQPCTAEATHKADWPRKRSTEAEQAAVERAAI